MRWLSLLFLAIAAALAEASVLARWPIIPDLPVALAVWVTVQGPGEGMVLRAWLVGMVADLADPGSTCFHALAFVGLAALFLPMRHLVVRHRAATCAMVAFVATVGIDLVDRAVSGRGDDGPARVAACALLTALATPALAWLVLGLPEAVQPIPRP